MRCRRVLWVGRSRTAVRPCPRLRPARCSAGIQICTADFLKGEQNGHGGATYGACAGVCLETQKFPDAPNHPEWPSAAVRKGSPLVSTTVYALSASAVSTEGRA
jgi:galactose mutarotase-like enzyme